MSKLEALRAPDHRSFIGPEFDAGPDGDDPVGLTYADVMADPKLAELGRTVFEQLKEQFAEDPVAGGGEDEAAYRKRLEGWADVLEILLDEVLAELETLNAGSARAPEAAEA